MDLHSFDSYTFFPGQHWGHTWERQHELVTRFAKCLEKKELFVSSPLGLLNHNPFSLDFIKRVIKYNKAQEEIKEVVSNPIQPNMRMVDAFHIPFQSGLIGRINYSLMKGPMHITRNNFFWSTYMNPSLYEFFCRSRFKVYDLAERRSHNPLLPQSVKDLERRALIPTPVPAATAIIRFCNGKAKVNPVMAAVSYHVTNILSAMLYNA